MAFVATEGPTGYRIETAKIATTTKAKATITAVIAGYRNFRIDGRVVDLSSTGLLSVATKGGIVGGSKKESDGSRSCVHMHDLAQQPGRRLRPIYPVQIPWHLPFPLRADTVRSSSR